MRPTDPDAQPSGRARSAASTTRRTWTLTAAATAAAAWWPWTARAQGGPVEGRDYIRLSAPMPTGAPAGQFEVIDFFWYGCPHCNAFEPALEAWVRQLPADVAFRRVPVAFRSEPYVAHQRIYYALDSLGLLGTMHAKVFQAIHRDHLPLDRESDISAYVASQGIDAAQFMQAYASFSTQTKLRQANRLVEGYQIDGVPAIGIHGRYYTSGTLAGENVRALAVADWLVQRLRGGAASASATGR